MAPADPSVGVLRHFVGQDVDRVRPGALAVRGQVWGSKRGAARGYHLEHILASLRAGQHVNSKAKIKQQMLSSLRLFHPTSWESKFRKKKLVSVPHATTLRRSVIKLDYAAMLAQRQVQRSALRAAVEGTLPDVQGRLLPLCVLGPGRMGLAEEDAGAYPPSVVGVWASDRGCASGQHGCQAVIV